MCGRYNIVTDAQALMDAFGILEANLKAKTYEKPRYNIAPSPPAKEGQESPARSLTRVPIVRVNEEAEREVVDAVWPLIPVWAKGKVPKYSTANARSESMAEKSTYRRAWHRRQRCLFVMSGFYEWKKVSGQRSKQPYHIQLAHRGLFGVAGLWEVSHLKDEEPLASAAIVTCGPNDLMQSIHNRMPVLVHPDDYDVWLNGAPENALALARPYPSASMAAYPISTKVNNPGFDDESIINPAPER